MCYNEGMARTNTESRRRLEDHVGLVIRKRRRELVMSQAQLAESMGTSQEIISNYEVGVTPVRADDLPRFAKVLGLTLNDFYSAHGSEMAERSVNNLEERARAPQYLQDQAGQFVLQSQYEQQYGVPLEGQYCVPCELGDLSEAEVELLAMFREFDEGARSVMLNISGTLLADRRNRSNRGW